MTTTDRQIPVVLLHNGCHEYMQTAITQACKMNNVILIGDTDPKIDIDGFEFFDIKNYWEECEVFAKSYIHLNTTSVPYETFCFQRWMVLRNFMRKENIDLVFHIDSDVLLFVDVNEEWNKYEQYDMTLVHRSAGTSIFTKLGILEDYCSFFINTYKNTGGYIFKKVASHYQARQETGQAGGVCDMTFFDLFQHHSNEGGGPFRVGEMTQIINDSTYDHHINANDPGYEFKDGLKVFSTVNKIPYIKNKRLNKNIKFNCLHFLGDAKSIMTKAYEEHFK